MTERMLIATTPAAVDAAQAKARDVFRLKMHATRVELAEARENLKRAERSKWATEPFKRAIKKLEAQATFYEKVSEALDHGYHIVPNFFLDAFAIRTDAKSPRGREKVSTYKHLRYFPQSAKALQIGDGRYVSDVPMLETWTHTNDKDKTAYVTKPDSFQDPIYPMCMARPELMGAAERAQSLMIFDEIGLARDQAAGCGDPMILGRILNVGSKPAATFFVAWALPLDAW